jgi:ribosomal protein L12E/L44/L45/RPP1/RPP2
MEQISNQTCTKCQNCGEWTNYADDEHHKARGREIEAENSRLRALLEGMEVQNIDDLLRETPELMRVLGAEIGKAAKHGADLYIAQKKAGI